MYKAYWRRSVTMSKRLCSAVALGALVATASAQVHMKAVKPAELVEETRAEYKVTQSGSDFGSEIVHTKLYDNNTIVYECEIVQQPGAGSSITSHAELVLTEDSHFPRSYNMSKVMRHADNEMKQEQHIEMVSNVAVANVTMGDRTTTRRIVVPAGAAILDQTVMHHLYQILFWYDRDVGGRQSFDIIDPNTGKTESVVLLLEGQDTIAVDGKDTPVTLFKVERDRGGESRAFVDGDGRIVRYELGLLAWNLVSFSRESVKNG